MLSPIFTSPQSRQVANHASAGIDAYSHWRKALSMFFLFLTWTILSVVLITLIPASPITVISIATLSSIVMVAVIAVTYIIFDDAISQKEETRSFGNLAKAAAQITVVLIMLYIGFLLFIVPGVFLMLFFGFAPAYIARGHSIGESFRLSRELARGQEAPTAQALAMLALVGVFIPQIMFLICIMPMMVGIGASVAESNPKSRYVRTSSMDVPVINSPFERKKD